MSDKGELETNYITVIIGIIFMFKIRQLYF